MAVFKLNYWELLSELELREGRRYGNISEMAEMIGVSRVTFYKYVDEPLSSVDAGIVDKFRGFLKLSPNEIGRLLLLDANDSPQNVAQDVLAVGAEIGVAA